MVDAIVAGMFHETMKTKMEELESRLSILQVRRLEAELQKEQYSFSRPSIKLYLQQFSQIKTMQPQEQKRVVEKFVIRVNVYEDHLEIDIRPWSFPGGGGGGGKAHHSLENGIKKASSLIVRLEAIPII